MADSQKIKDSHQELYVHIGKSLASGMPDFRSFLCMAHSCLPKADLARNKADIQLILEAMEKKGYIAEGNYKNLIEILQQAGLLRLKEEVMIKEKEIKELMKNTEVENVEEIPASLKLHCQLFELVGQQLDGSVYQSFLTIARACLNSDVLMRNSKYVVDILGALDTANMIAIGNYRNLIKILEDAEFHALKEQIMKKEEEIQQAMIKEKKTPLEVKDIQEHERLHCRLFEHVNRNLTKHMGDEFRQFLGNVRAYIEEGELAANQENAVQVLWVLERKGIISVGNYEVLEKILCLAGLKKLERQVHKKADEIKKNQSWYVHVVDGKPVSHILQS